MEAWILGLSCLQGLNQISNVTGSLWGQNRQCQRQYMKWKLGRGSQPCCPLASPGRSRNTHAQKPASEIWLQRDWGGPGAGMNLKPRSGTSGSSSTQELALPLCSWICGEKLSSQNHPARAGSRLSWCPHSGRPGRQHTTQAGPRADGRGESLAPSLCSVVP